VNAIPLVPDRLSYSEMYADMFKYPSEWSESFESYIQHKDELVAKITEFMTNYDAYTKLVPQQAQSLDKNFFSATHLLKNIN
jgi:hypothetical protein